MDEWNWTSETSAREGGPFSSQEDAEAWLSQTWQDLLDGGVEEVTLVSDDEVVYGPMPLNA